MKNKINDIFTKVVVGGDDWAKNAVLYNYHEKYRYHIIYFDNYEMDFCKLKIKFVPWNKDFHICRWSTKSGKSILKLSSTTAPNLAEEFDQAMLFIHNRQLKKQVLMDFI